MIKEVTQEDFAACLNTEFALEGVDSQGLPPVLKLSQVSERRITGPYETFSLVFDGPGDRLLPQQIYPLRHPRLGTLEIFLVPVGRDEQAVFYEAVFNHVVEVISE